MSGKRPTIDLDSFFDEGETGDSDQKTPSELRIQFFEGSHGVNAYTQYNVDLERHKPSKDNPDPISRRYSDAISNHAPESTVYSQADRFDTHHQMHQVRKEYLEALGPDMLEGQNKGDTQFGYKRPFVASDGKEYIFTFEFHNGVWKEVTGFPSNRRTC